MKKIILLIVIYFLAYTNTGFCSEKYEIFKKEFQITGNECKINIDVDAAKLIVSRSSKSDICFVYIKYNRENCEIDFNFDERENELDIYIDNIDFIHGDNHDYHYDTDENSSNPAKIVIELPSEPQIDIKTKVKAGELDFKLGDIKLRNFRLRNWAGDVEIDFDKPNRTTLEFLDIGCKFGELEVLNMGNAHCREADINSGIGELSIDFRGDFVTDLMAGIDLDLGETTIIIPEDINTKMKVSKFFFLSNIDYPNWFKKRGKYYYSNDYNDKNNTLFLDISTGIGELKIKVRK